VLNPSRLRLAFQNGASNLIGRHVGARGLLQLSDGVALKLQQASTLLHVRLCLLRGRRRHDEGADRA
jgi:hypothetical protein